MGTEILLPHDCLHERIRVPPTSFSRRRTYGNFHNQYNHYGNSFYGVTNSGRINVNWRPVNRPEQRKRVAVLERRPSYGDLKVTTERRPSYDDLKMAKGSELVMEKVMILRRGESLDSKMNKEGLRRKTGCEVYAGFTFSMSLSSSALQIPSFQKKFLSMAVDDSATRDLRRLLRIA
ncbi:unnamed protein product [Lathyrus sativus]|nr:unnamed protein product [Lathyrus sativus]